ncbi:MAG: MaoC/PaaZ C-terminal domain-containing protein [Chloroflexota bacterium]|nr:MaoC/PaaZ C-terminal domain-containing protein [Chloroflexota bacterium]
MASTGLENKAIPSLTKSITQVKINQFESCGIRDRENIHNSPELAKQRLGTTYPIASGRMSVAFASELLREFFGADTFHHSGVVNLKFLRPVKEGDTITVNGNMNSSQEVDGGTMVTVDISCQNQNGDTTAVGQGSAVLG